MDTIQDSLLDVNPGIQKMDPRVKQLWVTALRSGNYRQTRGTLRFIGKIDDTECDGTAYCCLGVLCDLYSQEFKHPWDADDQETYMGQDGILPDNVALWAGLSPWNGDVPLIQEEENFISAITLNDGRKYSFSMIADVIEGAL